MNSTIGTAQLLAFSTNEAQYVVRCGQGSEPTLPLAFESFLYMQPAHLSLQRSAGRHLAFYLENEARAQTVAQLHVFIDADINMLAYSPYQAPFGGIQMAPGVPAAALKSLMLAVHSTLEEVGVRRLRIRAYPFAYDPAGSALMTQVLSQLGYKVTLAELNNHLPLDQDFEARLHPSERRRLAKCRRHGFHFEQEPLFFLPKAYEFLRRCREEKGQHLSLSEERLTQLFRVFPNNHFLFSVRDSAGEWAALTVAIQVNERVLYNFYPASPLIYNAFSPVVLLNEGLHAFGRASGLALLDLGTSTLPTGLNQSLLQFKRHLGGILSLKLTLEWEAA
ncbi:hypothetical protein SAMN00120144_1935 [Hymenobacter roseosalivarius DSM 11622]|uniref:BioF2-like acetyltransferase domain-containing protein n=1 Tax=Hymenobacter roseosalivarius DSM 11622 TaxID=645990 RepID=A0A1W1W4K4_9BACT|nr:hypothetical protein SAMN00120144_1935 [Hymenobacter roseosalivarius DSM 11622]